MPQSLAQNMLLPHEPHNAEVAVPIRPRSRGQLLDLQFWPRGTSVHVDMCAECSDIKIHMCTTGSAQKGVIRSSDELLGIDEGRWWPKAIMSDCHDSSPASLLRHYVAMVLIRQA